MPLFHVIREAPHTAGLPFLFVERRIVRIAFFPPRLFFRLWILALLSFPATGLAGDSPYLSAAGPGARHQAILDLGSPAVVMSIAAEPGEEDLPTLTALRMGSGARVVSVYVTDGGATPSDIDGDLPLRVAARRKVEAESVIRGVGGEAFFLGFPDYGFVSQKGSLEQLWNRDSLMERFVLAIRMYRPDAILLASDVRAEGGDTVRSALIREILMGASGVSARPVPSGPGAWTVSRILEEAPSPGSGLAAAVDGIHPLWKKSYRRIAREAAQGYRSLRYQFSEWNAGRKGTYRSLAGRDGASRGLPHGLIEGLPVIPVTLNDAASDVRQAASDAAKGQDETALQSISRAIARVENSITTRKASLGSLEKRLLLSWKEKLEDLRCTVLGIDVRFAVSDTLIARRQLFTLRFPKDRKFPVKGRSEIIFPLAIDSTWLINRGEGFRFSFSLPDTFDIVTPEIMEFNRPVSTNGSDKFTLNTRIPFVIAHKDPDPLRNFACRREMVVGVSPVQSAEILTPFVRVTRGERLIVHLQNVSRDPYRGSISVGDSVALETRLPVVLRRSGIASRDTLPLAWRDSVPDGDHPVALRIGKGKPVGVFTARKFQALADTSRPVGLLTGLLDSPLEEALRRLHIPCRLLDGSFRDTSVTKIRTILIDRDACVLRPDGARTAAAIGKWVRAGGHCVMLRQHPRAAPGNPLTEIAGFAMTCVMAPGAPVIADSTSGILSHPNPISGADWRGWIISRAQSPVVASREADQVVHLRDELTGAPLITSVKIGTGTLTAVALDLLPQLQIVHPGACRLLANLVSY